MTIDLHIHSNASDGKLTVEDIFQEAKSRGIKFLSISDHDTIQAQNKAVNEAIKADVQYITGVELNITFSHPKYNGGKTIYLDFLGYQFNPQDEALKDKLSLIAKYREERAEKILLNLNLEFKKEGIPLLNKNDFKQIEATVEGTLGRPHIADYLIKKSIVTNRQEAFDKYLVKCDVPKYPLYLEEASKIMRAAGGKLVLAHGNDPHGTSLASYTNDVKEQTEIIKQAILPYIDGLECWHKRHTTETVNHYCNFAKQENLIMTGGSDCHQKPIVMGTMAIPSWVTEQFKSKSLKNFGIS